MKRCGRLPNYKVDVIRDEPRDRNKPDNISGRMEVSIITCNTPTLQSYLYVGSGKYFIEPVKLSLTGHRFTELVDLLSEKLTFRVSDFVRVGGLPTIPASSVKGNIRGRLELSFRAHKGRVRSCFSRASTHPPLGIYQRHKTIWGDVLNEDRGRPCDLTSMNEVCLICDLFGTAGLSSLICFEDFVGRKVTLEEIEIDGTRILAAPPGSEFEGVINFTNLKEEELGLLFLGMGLKESVKGRPLLLGKLKYRGWVGSKLLGRITYVVKALHLSNYSRNIEGFNLRSFRDEGELTLLITNLTSATLQRFSDEFKVVDEVAGLA